MTGADRGKSSAGVAAERVKILGVVYERSGDGQRLVRCRPNKTVNFKRQRQLEARKRAGAAAAAKPKKERKQRNCLYFCHLGRCAREKCPYLHDPSRVAVCRAFLLGTCAAGEACPLVHDRSLPPDRVPVCTHFLAGNCTRDECPYRCGGRVV